MSATPQGNAPIRWTGFDPVLPFEIGPMNGREARQSGRRAERDRFE